MDCIEQRDGLCCFVRLKLPDEVQLDVGVISAQRGPLRPSFLHPVFSKHTMPGLKQRADRLGTVCFGNRNQGYRRSISAGAFCRLLNCLVYGPQAFSGCGCGWIVTHVTRYKSAMRVRKAPLPKLWLMTDERGGDPVALARRLPKGAGIIFRHYAMSGRKRRVLFKQVRAVAKQRRLTLLLAGTPAQARAWGADGAHHRSKLPKIGLRSVAVHNRRELTVARYIKADLMFVSPVCRTRSHPNARPLGVVRLGLLVGDDRNRAVALGGIDATKFRQIATLRLHGWAGIDAFPEVQKRNAVPT
jgi:thiamine-phosphate pyrophosphorylase